LIS
jgi:hypothetical protein